MKAILCHDYAPPEKLRFEDVPDPAAKDGQAIIAIKAAGVGFVDGLLVQGLYQVKIPLPFIPGTEFSGIVESVGAGVKDLKPGDRVLGSAMGGACAEKIAVPAASCVPIPDNLDFAPAAGIIISYCTALYGLRACANAKGGETLLVLGAAGGVGSAAIQLAKAMGLSVIAAASSEEKRNTARTLGADHTVDYTKEDWRSDLKELTGGKGVDLVYDPVGGPISEAALRSLAPGGRHLVVGFAAGDIPRIPLNLPLLKRCSVVGVDWGGFARAEPQNAAPFMRDLMAMIAKGKLKPEGFALYPMAEAGRALSDIAARKALGKVVLTND
ncbi:alcohol dehydrogenase [Tepidicaulis marinus]|uniref:Alcohol dehydrogenase n=1 Tax=Tepidicaulis marinus TaxID=1333998 RepID=A0A081BDB6_9HYPH|nr:NADPH:quinone oxidoreductase family protein [Tepidicaulis marinus]GAK46034.1 alcohol dehydrogenase [Tepidicaulis marinus]